MKKISKKVYLRKLEQGKRVYRSKHAFWSLADDIYFSKSMKKGGNK